MILWNVLIIFCHVIGVGILKSIEGGSVLRIGDRLILSIWLGLSIISLILLAASLFFPLSPWLSLILVLLTIFALQLFKTTRFNSHDFQGLKSVPWIIGFVILESAIGFYIGTHKLDIVTDSASYHYPLIQWFSKYGVVPGLGLLNPAFGLISSWFALAAPLNSEIFEFRLASYAGGLLLLLFISHFIISLIRLLAKRALIQDWFILISSSMILPLIIKLGLPMSPSTNPPNWILVCLISWVVITFSNLRATKPINKKSILNWGIIPIILSISVFSIKVTGIPLVLTSFLLYCWLARKTPVRGAIFAMLLNLLLLAPILVSNTLISGYPLYPSTMIHLDVPWKRDVVPRYGETPITIGKMLANWYSETKHQPMDHMTLWRQWAESNSLFAFLIFTSISSAIGFLYFSRVKQSHPSLVGITNSSILLMASLFGVWFVYTNGSYLRPPLLAIFPVIIILTLSVFSLFNIGKLETPIETNAGDIWIASTALLGIGMLLIKAPLLRFGAGYSSIMPSLILAIFCSQTKINAVGQWVSRKMNLNRMVLSAFIGFGILFYFGSFFKSETEKNKLPMAINEGRITVEDSSLAPLLFPYKRIPFIILDGRLTGLIIEERYDNFKYYLVKRHCWNAPLPCINDNLPSIALRDPERGLKGGFIPVDRDSSKAE